MDVTAREQAQPSLLRDMVMLTKPRIISLLLVTTVAPMFVAGNPGWLLVLVVLVGGYLMAGGANAVNMYLDSDIDTRMARTRLRPIPSGRMGPKSVLAFGVALATAATFLLARFTNVLTALLALAGFYFYVFVYTRWLKRTTPQNIVIGGAAGAFPPLVGWASMTGTIDLTAVYLFLIIFYWTPPHFWALALLKQKDYGRAGIPMAPLVWGERETMRQMLWYNVILIALTLLPFTFGAFGIIYFVSAAVIGGILLAGVITVSRSADWTKPDGASTSFRCSILPCSFWRWSSTARCWELDGPTSVRGVGAASNAAGAAAGLVTPASRATPSANTAVPLATRGGVRVSRRQRQHRARVSADRASPAGRRVHFSERRPPQQDRARIAGAVRDPGAAELRPGLFPHVHVGAGDRAAPGRPVRASGPAVAGIFHGAENGRAHQPPFG